MIRVCFFADLRERLDCSQLDIALGAEATVEDVRSELMRLHPSWRRHLAEKKWLVAVNQTMATPNTPVRDNDEVAFFPPVTGG